MNAAEVGGQKIIGEVVTVTFRNAETGFTILRVKARDERDPITVVGLSLCQVGETIHAEGEWTIHPSYGRQLEASSIHAVLPTSRNGIERYLASGAIRGIGPVLAGRIVQTFGDETIAILDANPQRLAEVSGLGGKRADAIAEAWQANVIEREVMVSLAGFGIGTALAHRIVAAYGRGAADVVRNDPYRLAKDVRGVGFATADSIAADLGLPKDSPSRIEAGLAHLIRTVGSHGHCGASLGDFIRQSVELLNLAPGLIEDVLDAMTDVEQIIVRSAIPDAGGAMIPAVFDARLYRAEQRIAKAVMAMTTMPAPWDMTPERAVIAARDAERVCEVILEPEQRQSVIMALTNRISILTGGPGTGKTSTLKVVLQALRNIRVQVVMGAPTGKAAKRIRESTGFDAATLARLTGQGTGQEDVVIPADILIIDEASMIDVPLLDRVLKCLRDGAAILFVGDVDQLPSVGAGRTLADMIESLKVPTTRLSRIFRQAATSAIIRNAHRINRGEALEPRGDGPCDFHFLAATDPQAVADSIVALVTRHIPDRIGIAAADVQVLSPMRRTPTGADNLNRLLQQAINPTPGRFVDRAGRRFGVGDRVIQIVNNYELGVMNGESGIIMDVDHDTSTMLVIVDSLRVTYRFADLHQLDLSYAMSIHKSQGSQFEAVVIPVVTQHYMMLHRAIFYTGVTRASRFCVLVGQPQAIDMAIRNVNTTPRITTLLHRLKYAPGLQQINGA